MRQNIMKNKYFSSIVYAITVQHIPIRNADTADYLSPINLSRTALFVECWV